MLRVKGQHKSILIFMLNDNICAVQNEKNKFGSQFKHPSVPVVFDFYDCDCGHTWIQIW